MRAVDSFTNACRNVLCLLSHSRMNSSDGREMNLVNVALTFEETKGKITLGQNWVMEE